MRDVAARAHVALGTIYRYFSSKDHLLAAGLVEWVGELNQRLQVRKLHGDTTLEKLLEILRASTSSLEREPNMGAAMVTAITSPDPSVSQCQQDVSAAMIEILSLAIAPDQEDRRDGIISVLLHVWFSSLLGWVNGWRNVSTVGQELEIAAKLLCGQIP